MRRLLIIIAVFCVTATFAYSARLPNLGSYNPLSRFMEQTFENDRVGARDARRTRKGSVNKKPWVGDSLGDMEEVYYPTPVPIPGPCDGANPPYYCFQPVDLCGGIDPPVWCGPVSDICETPYPPEWCNWEPEVCEGSGCPEVCTSITMTLAGLSITVGSPAVKNPPTPVEYAFCLFDQGHNCVPFTTVDQDDLSSLNDLFLTSHPFSIGIRRNIYGLEDTGWEIVSAKGVGCGIKMTNIAANCVKALIYNCCDGDTSKQLILLLLNKCTGKFCTKTFYYENDLSFCSTCDNTATITGCPTKAVAFDSTTGLSTSGTGDYTWTLSGGGTLSDLTGSSTTYTAPSSNPECANNATVSLKCDGVVIDTCTIAVSSNVAGFAYVRCFEDTVVGYNPPCFYGSSTTMVVCYMTFYCSDDPTQAGGYNDACCVDVYGQETPVAWGIIAAGCAGLGYNVGITDKRSALLKSQGCCPLELY